MGSQVGNYGQPVSSTSALQVSRHPTFLILTALTGYLLMT
jgi:hypothetical protein